MKMYFNMGFAVELDRDVVKVEIERATAFTPAVTISKLETGYVCHPNHFGEWHTIRGLVDVLGTEAADALTKEVRSLTLRPWVPDQMLHFETWTDRDTPAEK